MLAHMTYDEALRVMDHDEHSQLKVCHYRRHIKLQPKFIGRVLEGLQEEMNKLIPKYCKELDGVPIAYRHVKLVEGKGRIIEDQPCIHCHVQTECLFFKPTVGCTLRGVINKLEKRHVVCLVHRLFNALLPMDNRLEGPLRDSLIGKEILFTVTGIRTVDKVLSMKGRPIIESLSSLMSEVTRTHEMLSMETVPSSEEMETGHHKRHKKSADSTLEISQASEGVNTTVDLSSHKHKKKKKKRKREQTDSNMETSQVGMTTLDADTFKYTGTDNSQNESLFSLDASPISSSPRKKKKKHKKHRTVDKDEDAVTLETVVMETQSGAGGQSGVRQGWVTPGELDTVAVRPTGTPSSVTSGKKGKTRKHKLDSSDEGLGSSSGTLDFPQVHVPTVSSTEIDTSHRRHKKKKKRDKMD